MSTKAERMTYLRRLYLTLAVAGALAYWPHPNALVRFLCLIVFGILCGWTERANFIVQHDVEIIDRGENWERTPPR